ncbi:galactose-specific lectin nattectin-like [Mixophyes fleayi]|uniref:galactose-specific lectin nattectin-like n=1 Tax=Mixophyes fleayi TaxID=3061075 RepID=UPI003F4DC83E
MFRLLLLLLVGTIYAQESENYGDLEERSDQDDIEDTTDPGSQDDGSDMSGDLPTSDLSHCQSHKCRNANMVIEQGTGHVDVCPHKGPCFYLAFNWQKDYWSAQRECKSRRGNLSSIHSLWANNQVRRLGKSLCTNQKYAWIGVNKANSGSRYTNVDRSRLDYTNWGKGHPRNQGTWCTAMYLSNGLWVSLNCKTQLSFVCIIWEFSGNPESKAMAL